MNKTITYDHGDYRMELDGQYIGHASTYSQAETTLNQTAYEWLTHGDCATATELDGGTFDPPGENPLGDDEGDSLPDSIFDSPRHRLAVGRVIVNFHKARHIPCKLCGGDHLTQHCPQIRALLFAEPVMAMDVDLCPLCECAPCDCETIYSFPIDVEHAPAGWAA